MSKRNYFVNAIRAAVEALRALHADRYNNWRSTFPADWKVNYAHGAREQAWLRYACKMYHNWLQREADRHNLQQWRDWADRTPEATKRANLTAFLAADEKRADDAAAQKWYDLCKMYDRADKTGSQAELLAYYNVKK